MVETDEIDSASAETTEAADSHDGTAGAELTPEQVARRLFASYLEEPEEVQPLDQEQAEEEPTEPVAEESDIFASLLAGAEGEEEEEEEEEQGAPEEEPAEGARAWYVIHSYSGYENKVKKNLEHRIESLGVQNKIFEIVVPTEEEIELKDGQRRTVERRIFPGYVLVDMIMDEDSWYVVRNTPGVTGFVGSVRKPTALPKRDVDKILKRMRAETPKVKVTFRPGQKVRICDGPFEDFVGSVDAIHPEKGKVRILVSFFGRETPVELDFLQVEKL